MKSVKSSRDRKREHGTESGPSSSSSASAAKKRVRGNDPPSTSTSTSEMDETSRATPTSTSIASKPGETLHRYLAGVNHSDVVKPTTEVATRIVEAIKACASTKPDGSGSGESSLYEDCLSAVRSFPTGFTHTDVVDLLVSMVRSCNAGEHKKVLGPPSANVNSAVFAINVLTSAFQDEAYPLEFVDMFMEDAVEYRYWVDQTYCSEFVENLRISFGTKPSPPNLLLADSAPTSSAPLRKDLESKDLVPALRKHRDLSGLCISPSSRYSRKETEVGNMIVNFSNETMQKKSLEVSKNLLKTLSFACGLLPVRVFAVSHLEQWLANPKCTRQAQQLLLSLCVNSNCNSNPDAEVVVEISKLRIKSKPVSQFFCSAIRELVKDNENNMRNVVSQLIYNELSLTRNPNNLMILGTIVPSTAEAFGIFAEVILDLFQKKDDFHAAIRQILREIQRTSRYESSLVPFVEGLLKAQEVSWRDPDVRDRAFKSITDLILFSMFLSCPPGLRGDDRDAATASPALNAVSKMQEEALRWLYMVAPKVYQPSKKDYIASFNKLVLKDTGTDLQSKDGFPSESERAVFVKLCARIPLSEPSIMWLLFNSLNSTASKEQNLTMTEILDYAEYLIMKAAASNCLLPMQKLEIIELLFRVSQYRHPENCALPIGYEPPKLAITKSYWRVWLLLCVLSSNNPSTLGKVGFESYPTLRALMEMCMTNHFSFPTPSSSSMEEIMTKERQLAAKEREQILEFEGYLAAASSKNIITKKNSLLLSQLMSLDPLGPCRCPPATVLSHLQSLNERLRLGVNLCRSRNPDFLVDLIQRNSQPVLNRLQELVSEGSFETLPVQCLCEFLLGQAHRLKKLLMADSAHSRSGTESPEKSFKKISKIADAAKEDVKSIQLVNFLKDIIHGQATESVKEVLEYFCIRLYSPKFQHRVQALQALELLFWSAKNTNNTTENWLIDGLPNIPLFTEVQDMIVGMLRKALLVESDPAWVCLYIEYLSTWGFVHGDSEIGKIAYDVAHLIVERNSVASLVLSTKHDVYGPMFEIFINFLRKAQEPQTQIHMWCDGQDNDQVLLLKWDEEKRREATVHVLIIHAIIILLSSYAHCVPKGGKKESHNVDRKHKELTDAWFGKGYNSPKGFLMNTSDEIEAVIYPDWIKLRMIRSTHSRLIAAALSDVTVDQLLLYVQSFGLPSASVTALLDRLDSAVKLDVSNVMEAITDAAYMKTLIEMHFAKGAKGGEEFYRLLKTIVKDEGDPTDLPKGTSVSDQTIRTFVTKRKPVPNYGEKLSASSEYYCKQLSSNSSSSTDRTEMATIIKILTATGAGGGQGRTGLQFGNSLGHFVDIFLQVEPCAVGKTQDAQLSLLLGRNKSQPLWRPLLLTVLIHESNWATVQECIQTCLVAFNPNMYDSGAVLDLVSATISNPKLWQGRDKFLSKHQEDSPAIKLDRNQITNLALYVMDEVNHAEGKNNNSFSISNILCPSDATTSQETLSKHYCIQERVKLWIKCCLANRVPVSDALYSVFRIRSSGWGLVKFLGEVYYEYPEVITKIDLREYIDKFPEVQSESVVDNITHSLIYAVANVEASKEFKRTASEIDQCLRKIAAQHPSLFSRQLNLMKALLEGRTHLEFSTFHAQNHHIPFQVYLGLLELIQPHLVNKKEKMSTLKSILELYIKVFTNYGHQKDYSITLGKFTLFIQKLLRMNQEGIRNLLATYYTNFRDLARCQYYEELEPLHSLMNSLVPPKSGSELSFLTAENNDTNLQAAAMDIPTHNVTSGHEDLIPLMQDLDYLSTRHPAVLRPFSHISAPLVRSDNDACRNQAFALILKHMTSFPEASDSYLEPVLKAWATKDGFCNNNILKRFNEFIVLSQETGGWLFKELFNVGVTTSNSQALAAVLRTIEFLRVRRSQT